MIITVKKRTSINIWEINLNNCLSFFLSLSKQDCINKKKKKKKKKKKQVKKEGLGDPNKDPNQKEQRRGETTCVHQVKWQDREQA
jgi:hypothetical protein